MVRSFVFIFDEFDKQYLFRHYAFELIYINSCSYVVLISQQ